MSNKRYSSSGRMRYSSFSNKEHLTFSKFFIPLYFIIGIICLLNYKDFGIMGILLGIVLIFTAIGFYFHYKDIKKKEEEKKVKKND